MTIKKLSMAIAIGVLLLIAIGIAAPVGAQSATDECTDPRMTELTDPYVPVEEMPTPVGTYILLLVQDDKFGLGLFVAHVDPQTHQLTGDGFLDQQLAPSLLLPVTTLTWDSIEVKVALCDGKLKWRFALVKPQPEATPEATPQSGS